MPYITDSTAEALARQHAEYTRQRAEAQQRATAEAAQAFAIRTTGEPGFRSDLEIIEAVPRTRTDREHYRLQMLNYNRSKVRFELSDQQILDAGISLQGFMTDEQWTRRTKLRERIRYGVG